MNKKIIFLAIMLISICGCTSPMTPIKKEETSNPMASLELLFEHDHVKVYRFQDGNNTIYYTSPASVTTRALETTDGDGNSTIEYRRVENRECRSYP